MAPENAKIFSSASRRSDFIMQNCSMKKYRTLFTVCIKFTKKKLKIEYNFFVYIFSNLTLHYAALCFLLLKAKLIPFIYYKNCIRYSNFKYNVSVLTGTDI
jgi:hypothetical protein